jgi:hypothetical protein
VEIGDRGGRGGGDRGGGGGGGGGGEGGGGDTFHIRAIRSSSDKLDKDHSTLPSST